MSIVHIPFFEMYPKFTDWLGSVNDNLIGEHSDARDHFDSNELEDYYKGEKDPSEVSDEMNEMYPYGYTYDGDL